MRDTLGVLARFSVFLMVWLALVSPTFAQTKPSVTDVNETAPVRLDGRRLFDLGPTGSTSALDRATWVARRAQGLIEREAPVEPFSPDNVIASKDPKTGELTGEQVVNIDGVSLLTVTAQDGVDAGQDARELAIVRGTALVKAIRDARATRQNAVQGAGILIINSFRDLLNSFLQWLPRVVAALLLAGVFWGLARLARTLTRNATSRFGFDPNLRALLLALSFYGVWFIGILAILSSLGLDSGSLAAAVGVSGFVLGFAFKDILAHFLAGILLLIGGNFRIGDQIIVRDFEGTVERIELRALYLRTYDNRLVIIPNADVFSAAITSNTASPHRRRSFLIPISHTCEIDRAQQVAVEAMKATSGVLDDPAPDVIIEDLTATGVSLRARFSTNSARSDYVSVGSECMKNVKLAFARENIDAPPAPSPTPVPSPAPTPAPAVT